MIRNKVKVEGKTYDKYGNLMNIETEMEEITAESVGDVLDLLAPYPRSASVYMIPPRDGSNIQQLQVLHCASHKDDAGYSLKGSFFQIGCNGPHDSNELFKKQLEREKEEKAPCLTEEQMSDVAEKFFEQDCYAIEDNVFMIDGHISIQTILDAADYIRTINNQ